MLAVAGVASAASAQRNATTTVTITSNGFTPQDVRIQLGDTVTWKNADSKAHSVVSDTGLFRSPSLSTNQTYSRRFDVEASYSYHDSANDSSTGTVDVVGHNVTIALTR